jgi:DNA invertase Pin-like site-specific DNA recombinase
MHSMTSLQEIIIAGYIRVSTREQANESLSLERQRERVVAAGADPNLIFVDTESASRKKDRRVELDKLLKLVQQGKIHKIVTRLDRIVRSVKQFYDILEIIDDAGANLEFLDFPGLDLQSPMGTMIATFFCMVAQLETDNLSQRIKSEKQQRRENQLANAIAPFGYTTQDKQYQLDRSPFLCLLSDKPDVEDMVMEGRTICELAREAVELFLVVRSPRATLHRLFQKYGVQRKQGSRNGSDKVFSWTPEGFIGWLCNPVLQGNTPYLGRITVAKREQIINPEGPTILLGTHLDQRLLTDEEVEAIQQILEINRRIGSDGFNRDPDSPQVYKEYAYLNGLVYCYECGAKCTPKTASNGKYQYFACRYAGAGCCNKGSVKKSDIEVALIQNLTCKSQQMRQQAMEARSSYTNMVYTVLQMRGAGDKEMQKFAAKTHPQYEHWKNPEGWGFESMSRLAQLKAQRDALDDVPGAHYLIEEAKKKLDAEIQEEADYNTYFVDREAAEILFEGSNLAFWQGLTHNEKVTLYDKVVHRIYIEGRDVKRIDLNSSPTQGLERDGRVEELHAQ